jgi:hypothetical protein
MKRFAPRVVSRVERHIEVGTQGLEPGITGADLHATGIRAAGQVQQRHHPSADPASAFDHLHRQAACLQGPRRRQSGQASPQHQHVGIPRLTHGRAA